MRNTVVAVAYKKKKIENNAIVITITTGRREKPLIGDGFIVAIGVENENSLQILVIYCKINNCFYNKAATNIDLFVYPIFL